MRYVLFLVPIFTAALPVGAQQTLNPHGALKLPCANCHAPDAWKPARIAESFRHAPGTFPLEGAHIRSSCTGCHKKLDFTGLKATCRSCHDDVHKGELGADCARCHTPRSFAEQPSMKQAHELTRFPLRGAHSTVSCSACHAPSRSGGQRFVGTNTTCAGCHAAAARSAVPDHRAAAFLRECTACHTINSWAGARFDHAQTAFPLLGAHQAATCEGCHADKVYDGKSTQCVACHRPDYDKAESPRHTNAFPTTCADCHGNVTWEGARFDHGMTRFALTGAHNAASCAGCHADGVYSGKSMECATCHQSAFRGTTNPPHGTTLFNAPCSSCHTTNAWGGASFNHDATKFALTGSHRAASCATCHADRVFAGKPSDCFSCHRAKYDGTTTPAHAAAGYPTTCATCHGTADWKGAFNHSTTRFALTGAHNAVTCNGCHADGVFNGRPADCASCHRAKYDATSRPAHAAAGYSTACATCHNTNQWLGAVFNHSTTQFPLTGAHVAAPCQSCHADNVYRGKPTDCYSCHRTKYDATTRPPHGASAIGTACTSCHTTTGWVGGTYDHSVTSFPLTGAHRAATCARCHADGVYGAKPTDCFGCHQAQYAGTRQPPHAGNGIGTTCQTCHTTTVWTGGTFNHGVTAFPLTGAHIVATCQGCHGDGVYRGKSTICLSCHQIDYNQTTNPNHTAAGFPTTCAGCHTTTTWLGATFNHDAQFFPVNSGKHRGKWSSCATCHTSPTNYKVFTCLSCHEHRQTEMDDKHKNRSGYRYDSQACYACHPRGDG